MARKSLSWFGRAFLAAGFAGSICSPGAVEGSPMGHAGRWMTDAQGRVFLTHGVNMVWKPPPYYPSITGFDEDDAAFLRLHGFNSVRLGIIFKAVEPIPGHFDDHYLERIAETVRVLSAAGIQTLVDMHQDAFNERFLGEGFPDWFVQDDGLPNYPNPGFPFNLLVMPSVQRAYDHLWENSPGPGGVGLQEHYANAWTHVAAFFRDEPGVLGYDTFNEPFPGTMWHTCAQKDLMTQVTVAPGCQAFDKGPLTTLNRKLIAGIRLADSEHLAFYEPNLFSAFGPPTFVGDPQDGRAGFSFHNYCTSASFGGGNTATCDSEPRVFARAQALSEATGDALLMTEFGAVSYRPTLERMTDEADQAMMPWQYWAYFNQLPGGGSAREQIIVFDPSKPLAGDNVDHEKLDVLVRAYPMATAGTPIRYFYDRTTRAFDFEYSTAPAGAPLAADAETEIYVPPLHYPQGYLATVNGGSVTSASGSAMLRVRASEGADRVVVRVTPAP